MRPVPHLHLPHPNPRLLRRVPAWLRWLRQKVRGSEFSFIALAIVAGMAAGLATVLIGGIARGIQHILYGLPADVRLSGAEWLDPWRLLVLPAGGAALALFTWAVRARKRPLVDAVEANALHGGRMSKADSGVIAGQTMLSNGVGASVGLEAAYAQVGGLFGSLAGRWLSLRRADMRVLVGAGSGAAIAAAFGAPIAGAFYAFEIVIGAYTPAAIAPVAAAALAGAQVSQRLGEVPYIVHVQPGPAIHTFGYLVYAGLAAICALYGILIMRAVTLVEVRARASLPGWARPAIGGLLLVPIAAWSPQALSAGHSALHIDMMSALPVAFIAGVLLAKSCASIVSLGFGFRGGLFFASLFLGTLIGHLYADFLALLVGFPILDPANAALVGMAALAVAVVGGPFTMAMLVLEATGNFSLTGAVLAASLVSSTIVRELFGYSFSTWRFHLRGETIKSARDVGWMKALTAGRMMRRGAATAPAAITIAELRRRFPLGATSRVVLVGEDERYAGVVTIAAAFAEGVDREAPAATLAHATDAALSPDMDLGVVMKAFDTAATDELAVLDADGHVLGIVTETYVRRRYAEELDKAQRALFGEE
ncbi:chloride channel protein [Sphingomonas sp. CL5.1]|uniref:chloride channel protein n=1 Tax=Sphingomonas sp. CL5.1 TaxID=2653203 RepID=UPI001581D2DA|nr:chloride channel protein [Sphingomonas sp. CL5.1]QKR98749.1 chloride channel protein [Sphingomonas sp. CL5.1]